MAGVIHRAGGITVAASIQERDSRTLVCGVWAQSREQSILTKNKASHVVARGAIFVDGRAVVRDLSFMREVPPTADYAGAPANCHLTERAWQPGDESKPVSIRIPRQVVEIESGGFIGGFAVVFKQDGPGAGI